MTEQTYRKNRISDLTSDFINPRTALSPLGHILAAYNSNDVNRIVKAKSEADLLIDLCTTAIEVLSDYGRLSAAQTLGGVEPLYSDATDCADALAVLTSVVRVCRDFADCADNLEYLSKDMH